MTAHHVRPDHHPLPTGTRTDGVGHVPFTPRPKPSTAPPGLWAPTPEVVAEKVVKAKSEGPRKPREPSSVTGRKSRAKPKEQHRNRRDAKVNRCGSKFGYDDHLIRGEVTCQPCRDAIAADVRRRYAENRSKPLKPPTTTDKCGTPGGRAAHRRRNEHSCDDCRIARNAWDRKRHEATERKAA